MYENIKKKISTRVIMIDGRVLNLVISPPLAFALTIADTFTAE